MLEQRSYDPYGDVLNVDGLSSAPLIKVGHKGLFYERFDQLSTAPPIAVGPPQPFATCTPHAGPLYTR